VGAKNDCGTPSEQLAGTDNVLAVKEGISMRQLVSVARRFYNATRQPNAIASLSGRILFVIRLTAMILLLVIASGFDVSVASAQSASNNLATVDGVTYPYTAAGVQSAINAVYNVYAKTGSGGVVILPAASIWLASTTLTMASHVCVVGQSSDSSWLTYGGAGSAIVFPVGTEESCLKHVTVGLGGNAGANAIGINVLGNYTAGLFTIYTKLEDVSLSASYARPGQIGINLADRSSPQPAPAGIQLSWFDTIKLTNFGQPIVTTGGEGNFWNNTIINRFSTIPINDSYCGDNYWTGVRIGGAATSASAIGFQEGGRMNHIQLTCDFGTTTQLCINDLGGRDFWEISALTPLGNVASTSFLQVAGSLYSNIPDNFQVSNDAVTAVSPSIVSDGPSCLEMGNSNGTGGTNYVTFLNGAMSVGTIKPASCP
jgi:hypothetical protein